LHLRVPALQTHEREETDTDPPDGFSFDLHLGV
jgi:hypothetical protein